MVSFGDHDFSSDAKDDAGDCLLRSWDLSFLLMRCGTTNASIEGQAKGIFCF